MISTALDIDPVTVVSERRDDIRQMLVERRPKSSTLSLMTISYSRSYR